MHSNRHHVVGILVLMVMAIVSTSFADSPKREPRESRRTLRREGTRVELVGSFRGGGVEAISFRPKGSDESIRVLENLALERVAKVLNVNKRREWEISAEVTEFESVNYLLLKRVALKGRAAVSSSPLETASATPTN